MCIRFYTNKYYISIKKCSFMARTREDKIMRAFENKTWQEIKVKDSWQIFKIMAEFVDGFEKLAKIGPCVSMFGSARTPQDHNHYKLAEDIARLLTERGYGVVSGRSEER